MSDPISLVAASVGIADVSFRVIQYLKDVKAGAETIQADIAALIAEVQSLMSVHGHLEQDFRKNVGDDTLDQEVKMLWFHTGRTLQDGQKVTKRLEDCVREVFGQSPSVGGRRDGLSKTHRLQDTRSIITGLRAQIATYIGELQIWLAFLSRLLAQAHHDDQTSILSELTTVVHGLESKVVAMQDARPPTYDAMTTFPAYSDFTSTSLSVLKQMTASVSNIEDILKKPRVITNEHFDIPRPVDQNYTGREDKAKILSDYMLPNDMQQERFSRRNRSAIQKRFVVCGIGGSGKTQFISKWAQDHREFFWGVFWVDGSSEQRFRQSYSANVCNLARVDANEKAALHWLANLNERWLLIIDNADDTTVDVESHLPRGNRGHVLITTRNQSNRRLGNIGPGYFDFEGLDNEEATCLLFKAAGHRPPWDSALSQVATEITTTLGYLAIAVAQAGSTIREGLCKFSEYLEYYERQWVKTRQKRQAIKSKDTGDELRVYTTFDLNIQAMIFRETEATRDALQLLNTFAFLNRQNIRFEILKKSITNAQLERQHENKKPASPTVTTPVSWSTTWKTIITNVTTFLQKGRPETLPNVIRDGRGVHSFDPDRLRAALSQLTQVSLVAHDDRNDVYSLHPLVHKWARERPDLSVTEQAVWCGVAALLLSHCILLPPLGSTIEDEEMRKDLLPHIDHVRHCQDSIDQRMRDNRMPRMKPWPIFESGFDRDKALMYAKFSTVYMQNGRWQEAKRLQLAVRHFTMKVLGLRDIKTRCITTALSVTLLGLGQCDDAAALQKELLDECVSMFGSDQHETLMAKHMLGESRYFQGRISDASQLQEEAVAGLTKLHGMRHEDTLVTMDSLGRTLQAFRTNEALRRARVLHLDASKGMGQVLGDRHLTTLKARECLCASAVQSGIRAHVEEAHGIMVDVYEIRKERLGKENPYTLLAMVNLAMVKSALGYHQDAEGLILIAQPIAERNLGPDHQGYLWARYELSRILMKQKRWGEAEQLLCDVTERQRSLLQGRGEYHPDRLRGLVELATVYYALGKHDECKRVAREALEGFERISKREHPIARKLKEDMELWNKERDEGTRAHAATALSCENSP